MKYLVYVFLFICGYSFASDIEVVGQISQSVQAPQPRAHALMNAGWNAPQIKHITLLKLQLSDKANYVIRQRLSKFFHGSLSNYLAVSNASSIELGMNNVPVFDQGSHGTCATFANTAAVDAALNKGDYISQLCQLQLGNFLEKNGYRPSGWNGSLGPFVLHQMESFGIVSKQQEKSGCGGYTQYPLNGGDPESAMSLSDFRQISELMSNKDVGLEVSWTSLLDIYQVIMAETDTAKTLKDVKLALQQGDRVTFGVLLVDLNLGVVGAVGTHQKSQDSWVISAEIAHDVEAGTASMGGHEMLITGFNDEAVARDDNGTEHHGLLTLRNSWGKDAGNQGDFYMSYDYFKALVIEAQRIRAIH